MKSPYAAIDLEAVIQSARAFVFDFDGTLVDSNEIKWRGFEVAFADFPDRLGEIMAYCRQWNHTHRSEKFRYVCERILGLSYTDGLSRVLHERYAAATEHAVVSAPEIPGAMAFLRRVSNRYRTALVSSTPHEVLLAMLDRREMRSYFDDIRGAPVDKSAWLTRFRVMHSLAGEQVIFWGDTEEDEHAAQTAGCVFIGVANVRLMGNAPRWIPDFRSVTA